MDAGWYIDPDDPASGRYHDGTDWTAQTVTIPPGKTLPHPSDVVAALPPLPPSPPPPVLTNGPPGSAQPQPSPSSLLPVPVPRPQPVGPPVPPPVHRPVSVTDLAAPGVSGPTGPTGPTAGANASATRPTTGGASARLSKPPKTQPQQDRKRLMIMLGVLAALIVVVVVLYVVKHGDSSDGSGAAGTSSTTLAGGALPSAPRASDPAAPGSPAPTTAAPATTVPPHTTTQGCHQAFIRQLGDSGSADSGIDSFSACNAKQWVKAYDISALQLGNANPDGLSLLESECVKRRVNGTEPAACIGVPPPPTSG